jgi:hypothetical protein
MGSGSGIGGFLEVEKQTTAREYLTQRSLAV